MPRSDARRSIRGRRRGTRHRCRSREATRGHRSSRWGRRPDRRERRAATSAAAYRIPLGARHRPILAPFAWTAAPTGRATAAVTASSASARTASTPTPRATPSPRCGTSCAASASAGLDVKETARRGPQRRDRGGDRGRCHRAPADRRGRPPRGRFAVRRARRRPRSLPRRPAGAAAPGARKPLRAATTCQPAIAPGRVRTHLGRARGRLHGVVAGEPRSRHRRPRTRRGCHFERRRNVVDGRATDDRACAAGTGRRGHRARR